MTVPVAQLLDNKLVISAKKYQFHFRADPKVLPIRSFQGRAGQHGVLVCGNTTPDQLTQAVEPRPPVFIGQWNSTTHFLDICR